VLIQGFPEDSIPGLSKHVGRNRLRLFLMNEKLLDRLKFYQSFCTVLLVSQLGT
jgi:hypothetical protein